MSETSEMVERVRNAIDAAWMDWNLGDGRGRSQADVPVELLALAAVTAMTEPTEAMLNRGGYHCIRGAGGVTPSDKGQAKAVYRAMLQVALLKDAWPDGRLNALPSPADPG